MLGVRRWPVLPTLVVIAAAAVMVTLGFWQLQRLAEKEALIARFALAAKSDAVSNLGPDGGGDEQFLYRKVRIDCAQPKAWIAIAGRNDRDQTGYVHQFNCQEAAIVPAFDGFARRPAMLAVMGWSPGPQRVDFAGGMIEGTLVRAGDDFRVVASTPLAGLEANATPDPNDLPNNHLAYAVQWFFFAATALVIYVLALRRRQRGE